MTLLNIIDKTLNVKYHKLYPDAPAHLRWYRYSGYNNILICRFCGDKMNSYNGDNVVDDHAKIHLKEFKLDLYL